METVERGEVVEMLVAGGTPIDRAIVYADAFLEYRLASANISQCGLIVGHPRTGNPIENPYLAVRDRAVRKLANMRNVKAEGVWAQWGGLG